MAEQRPKPELAELLRERFGDPASLERERPAPPYRPSTPAEQAERRRDAERGWR